MRGRPIEIHSHQHYSKGYLVCIGGLNEHGWFIVEDESGTTYKYTLQYYHFNFLDVKKDKNSSLPG